MELRGNVEVVSWVLGFGGTAEVLAPPGLGDQVRDELRIGLGALRIDRRP